jgi:nucleoside-diphosphate-sugar epimerase
MNSKKVIITGTSGFIGNFLMNYLLDEGHSVYAFQREKRLSDKANLKYIAYDLNDDLNSTCFKDSDVLIHCAYKPLLTKNEKDLNYSGAQKIIELCRKYGVKIIFLSTVSAQEHISSRYGQSKLAIEGILNIETDIILNLGLVIGNGGLFSTMFNFIKKSFFIPVFNGGRQEVQFIEVNDIGRVISHVLNEFSPGKYILVKEEPLSIISLYKMISESKGKKRFYINFSIPLTYRVLKVFENLGIRLPITSENIKGLKEAKKLKQNLPKGILDENLSTIKEALKGVKV